MQKIKLVNVNVDIGTTNEMKEIFVHAMQSKDKCTSVMFLNAFALTLAQKDETFRQALNSADYLINDGIGIEKLVNKAGHKVPENLNGTDLIPKMVKWTADLNKTIFLLGTKEENVSAAKNLINLRNEKDVVVDYNNGYFNENEIESVIAKINASGASFLILGMGMPLQEKWILEHKDKLENVKVIIAGGAIIDYLSGKVKRSPDIWVRLKLEWLYRMLREPKRLFLRNWLSIQVLIKFYFKVGKNK